MNRIITRKEITAGYALAGMVLCLGLYFSTKVGDGQGSALLKSFYLLTALIVLNSTFKWGGLRGFTVRREDGSIVVGNVIRNLVMSAIVWVGVLLVFAPLAFFLFRFAR